MLRQRAAIAHPAHGTREIKSQLATSHYSSKTNPGYAQSIAKKGYCVAHSAHAYALEYIALWLVTCLILHTNLLGQQL